MPNNKQEPSRLELYKAGKIEGRRSARTPLVPDKAVEEQIDKENEEGSKLRPEVAILALMVILLLIIAAIAI